MSEFSVQGFRKANANVHRHAQQSWPVYSTMKEEQLSWIYTCCLGDWSFIPGQAIISGPGSIGFFKDFSVNTFSNFKIGQAKHMINCNRDGKVIFEGVLFKLAEEEFQIIGSPGFWLAYQSKKQKYRNSVNVELIPANTNCNFQISGPNSVYLLEELSGESLRELKFMRFKYIRIGGKVVRVTNGLSMAGEIGFELTFSSDAREVVYNSIILAGKRYGLRELGSRNHQVNHTLAMFPTIYYHYITAIYDEEDDDMIGFRNFMMKDIPNGKNILQIPTIRGSYEGEKLSDYYHSPIELGWIRNIKNDHAFLGKEALLKEKDKPHRKIVSLVYNDEDIVDIFSSQFKDDDPYEFMNIPIQFGAETRHDKVMKDGKLIGISTHPAFSFYYQESITLAYIDVEYLNIGTEVEVLWGRPGKRQKTIRAVIAGAPYKPDRRRTDLKTLPDTLDLSKVPDLRERN